MHHVSGIAECAMIRQRETLSHHTACAAPRAEAAGHVDESRSRCHGACLKHSVCADAQGLYGRVLRVGCALCLCAYRQHEALPAQPGCVSVQAYGRPATSSAAVPSHGSRRQESVRSLQKLHCLKDVPSRLPPAGRGGRALAADRGRRPGACGRARGAGAAGGHAPPGAAAARAGRRGRAGLPAARVGHHRARRAPGAAQGAMRNSFWHMG